MARYSEVINAVKDVLDDETKMKNICSFKQNELDQCVESSKIRYRLNLLLENAKYYKKAFSPVPEDLQHHFQRLKNDGTAKLSDTESVLDSIPVLDLKENALIKERIEHMLEFANFDISKYDDVSSKLEEYENALAVNKTGYRPFYKRDVAETMVNTYNSEWLAAWNGNMDIQLCLDFFAVITYISDYYSKDDSGTMKFFLDALKDAENEDLRTKFRKVQSVFLTHRQIGESEAYYRNLPHLHLKGSNIEAVFGPTGFNPSKILNRIEDNVAHKYDDVIEVYGREGKYQEKASLYEKYLRRDCKLQPEIKDLCYAQFVKKYSSHRDRPPKSSFKIQKVDKTYDESGNVNVKDVVITKNIDDSKQLYLLPTYIRLKQTRKDEPAFMKKRSEAVLRLHKFKKTKHLHEYLFSELQLYHPHTNNEADGQDYCLLFERDDLEICQKTYDQSNISIVKRKIMPFLENVEEGMAAAHDFRDSLGAELDPQNEQDRLECEDIGLEDNPEYAAKDFEGITNENDEFNRGLFKTTTLMPDDTLFPLIHRLDIDQRMVVDVVLRYLKKVLIARKKPFKFVAPKLIVQGGAGAGKSSVITVIVQLVEKLLRKSGDDTENPYILPLSFTGTAAANIDGMTLHSAFNFPFSNEFLSLSDRLRDKKRDYLKNLKIIILDEFSMVKADLLYQIDLRLRELLQNTNEPFGGCAVLMFGDLLQLRPVMGKYIFELPRSTDYHVSYHIEPLWETFGVIQLLTNHRQGEDFDYAEVLNRIRAGSQTENDYNLLEQRVKPENHSDIPPDALFVTCKNKHVNEINEHRLEMLEGDLIKISAIVKSCSQKQVNAKTNTDGSIFNTPLQKNLRLKVGAKVMLTFNIDVIDSLTNGAFGEIKGFQYTSSGSVKTVLVHFKNEKVGQS